MELFSGMRKKRAIRSYIQELPRLLRKDYGISKSYTSAQVIKTIERSGLNSDYSCYALSMFSDRMEFERYHESLGESCDYIELRSEVASSHFGGNPHFSFSSMDEASVGAFDSPDQGGHHRGADGHGHFGGGE